METPNILVIHADQHRADCIGAYGNSDIQTPHIDGLASDGVRFDQSFCPFPVCTPSRYSLLTGLYVHQHLGWTNHCTLPRGVTTFPGLLRDAGYRTAAVGKMHFTPTYLDVGFQDMVLAEQDGPGRFDDDYHRWLRDEGKCDSLDLIDQRSEYRSSASREYWDSFGAVASNLDERHHSTTWIADRGVEKLESWTDGGNLLMAGFIKPHHPFDPPAPWDSMYDPEKLSLLPGWTEEVSGTDLARSPGYFPHTGLAEPKLRQVMALYYATISQIDHHVGRMVELLKQKGLYDNTVIIYTSDHGDYMGYHHLLLKGNYMYDPLIKVPLIIKYPKSLRKAETSSTLVSNVDIAPTLLNLAGVDHGQELAGIDLADKEAKRGVVFAEARGGKAYMARSHTRKLLLCDNDKKSQFFNLESDPFELDNRIADPMCSSEIAALREALSRWALFDAPSRTHLNVEAPALEGDHMPLESTEGYFKKMMSEKPVL